MFNSYDRPIPRRILEENGVQRNLVGVKKRVSGVYVTEEGLEKTLSQKSFNDFNRYLKNNWKTEMSIITRQYKLISKIRKINESIVKRIHYKMNVERNHNYKLPILLPKKLEILSFGYIGKHSLLFQWGSRKGIEIDIKLIISVKRVSLG